MTGLFNSEGLLDLKPDCEEGGDGGPVIIENCYQFTYGSETVSDAEVSITCGADRYNIPAGQDMEAMAVWLTSQGLPAAFEDGVVKLECETQPTINFSGAGEEPIAACEVPGGVNEEDVCDILKSKGLLGPQGEPIAEICLTNIPDPLDPVPPANGKIQLVKSAGSIQYLVDPEGVPCTLGTVGADDTFNERNFEFSTVAFEVDSPPEPPVKADWPDLAEGRTLDCCFKNGWWIFRCVDGALVEQAFKPNACESCVKIPVSVLSTGWVNYDGTIFVPNTSLTQGENFTLFAQAYALDAEDAGDPLCVGLPFKLDGEIVGNIFDEGFCFIVGGLGAVSGVSVTAKIPFIDICDIEMMQAFEFDTSGIAFSDPPTQTEVDSALTTFSTNNPDACVQFKCATLSGDEIVGVVNQGEVGLDIESKTKSLVVFSMEQDSKDCMALLLRHEGTICEDTNPAVSHQFELSAEGHTISTIPLAGGTSTVPMGNFPTEYSVQLKATLTDGTVISSSTKTYCHEPCVVPCVCSNRLADGSLQGVSTGTVSESGKYEHSHSLSTDGGATWVIGFNGAPGWRPINEGDSAVVWDYPMTFPQPGSEQIKVRHSIREIENPSNEYTDEKCLPDPVAMIDGTTLTFVNDAVESHPCYVESKDQYVARFSVRDADFNLKEQWVSPTWKPSNGEQIDISSAPALVQSLFNSSSPTSMAYTADPACPNIDVDLSVCHVYECDDKPPCILCAVSSDRNDANIGGDPDYECQLNLVDILGEPDDTGEYPPNLSIALTSALFTDPGHNGDFRLRFIGPNGEAVAWSSGSMVQIGDYVVGSGSSFPLLPGNWSVVLEVPSGTIGVCEEFAVAPWNICEQYAKLAFEGLTGDAVQCIDLPIDAGLEGPGLDWYLAAYSISDRLTIEYNGNIIHDTTQQMGSASGNVAFTYVPGVDFITVCVESDGTQPANTVTIYQAFVGCCPEDGDFPTLPKRYPIIWKATGGCAEQVRVVPPYTINNFLNFDRFVLIPPVPLGLGLYKEVCFRENLDLKSPKGCLGSLSDVGGAPSYLGGTNCVNRVHLGSGCIDLPAPVGTPYTFAASGAVAEFENFTTGSYAILKAFFQQLEAEYLAIPWSQGEIYRVNLTGNKNVPCGDDGQSVPDIGVYYSPDCVAFDDVNETITLDFTGKSTVSDNCCQVSLQEASLIGVWQAIRGLGQTNGRVWLGEARLLNRPGGTTLVDGRRAYTFNWGITYTPCPHSNPVQPYTVVWAPGSIATTWELWEGSPGTGTLISDADDVGPASTLPVQDLFNGNPLGDHPISGDRCGTDKRVIKIRNADGFGLDIVDFATKTFDMTAYGGGLADTFTDGNTMALFIGNHLGETIHFSSGYSCFVSPVGSTDNIDVSCN